MWRADRDHSGGHSWSIPSCSISRICFSVTPNCLVIVSRDWATVIGSSWASTRARKISLRRSNESLPCDTLCSLILENLLDGDEDKIAGRGRLGQRKFRVGPLSPSALFQPRTDGSVPGFPKEFSGLQGGHF